MFLRDSKKRSRFHTAIFIIAVFCISLFIRLWEIDDISSGFSGHQFPQFKLVETLMEPSKISRDNLLTTFFSVETGPLAFIEAGWHRIAGISVTSMRTLPAIVGSISILFFFLFGTQILGRSFGLLFSLLVSSSVWHLTFSRYENLEHIAPILVISIVLYLLAKISQKPSGLRFALLGILTGLSIYLYASTQIFLLYIPLVATLVLLQKKPSARSLLTYATFYSVFLCITIFPQLSYNISKDRYIPIRKLEINKGLYTTSTLEQLPSQIELAWKEFFIKHRDPWMSTNQSVVSQGEVLLFLLGLGFYFQKKHTQNKKISALIMLLLFIFGLIPAVFGPYPLFFRRMLFSALPIYFLAGFGIWSIYIELLKKNTSNPTASYIFLFLSLALILGNSVRYFSGPFPGESTQNTSIRSIIRYAKQDKLKRLSVLVTNREESDRVLALSKIENYHDDSSLDRFNFYYFNPLTDRKDVLRDVCKKSPYKLAVTYDLWNRSQRSIPGCILDKEIFSLGNTEPVAVILTSLGK